MFDQLETMVGRYEELGELLSDPQVVNDTKRFMELSREEASLRDTVATYNEYKRCSKPFLTVKKCLVKVALMRI